MTIKFTPIFVLFSAVAQFASAAEKLQGNVSTSVGWHRQGLMLNFVYTGSSKSGFFLGGSGSEQNSKDNKTKDCSEVHGGVALRLSEYMQLGFGYGYKTTHMHDSSNKTSQNGYWQSGKVVMLDVGMRNGVGLHFIGGAGGAGVGLAYRF